MTKLNDFLGGLASGISNARVNSDIQSLKIAEEYSKNDLLKHFSVPRMRIDKVELNIPIAVDNLSEKTLKTYQDIDRDVLTDKTYNSVLKSISVDKVSSETQNKLKDVILEYIKIIENKIKGKSIIVDEIANNIASKANLYVPDIYKENNKRIPSINTLDKLRIITERDLNELFKKELVVKEERNVLDSVNVIVEADKLREIKPENVIMIKMTISEQGMEWVSMEDINGEVVKKLMPE